MICGLTLRSWSCDPLLLGLRDYSCGLFSLAAGLRPGTRQEIVPKSAYNIYVKYVYFYVFLLIIRKIRVII